MVPLSTMFRFYEPVDMALLAAGALFSALGGALFPAVNVAFGNMLDSTAVGDVGSKINNAVIAMEIVAVSLGVSLTLGYWFTSWGAARAARNMRSAFVRAMLAQDINFFESKKAGEIATLTGATVNDFQTGMSKKFAELIQSGFSMAGGFGVGFYFNAELSGVILATVPLLGFATFFLIKSIQDMQKGNVEYESAAAVATETIGAIRVTNALNYQNVATNRFKANLGKAQRHGAKQIWKASFAGGGLFASMFIMYALGLWYGAKLIADSVLDSAASPCLTGGTIVMVFFSILFGGFALGQAGPAIEALAKARMAAFKIYGVIDRKPENGIDTRKPTGVDPITPMRGEIVFKDVDFEYSPQRPVFSGLNLTIEGGAVVALVGASGCGKSTITKLVERFYDPMSGTIFLDGVDLRNIRIDKLRANIGIVSQEPLLFEASIADNIAAGRPQAIGGSKASMDEIVAAAEAACAHEFIMSFPNGYNTMVGGKNSKLSGGQKQRIAIARAALRNPAILILDEATSALDTENEMLVQDALDGLVHSVAGGQRTTIVIAHRLTTVRDANKIVVLGSKDAAAGLAGGGGGAHGSIVLEQGTHDELMALGSKGMYRNLVGLTKDDGSKRVKRSASLSSFQSVRRETSEFGEEFTKKDVQVTANKPTEVYKVSAARVWKYSKEDVPLLITGMFFAIANGCVMPSVAFVFAELLTVFYMDDITYMRERSAVLSGAMGAVAVGAFLVMGTQGGIFGNIGERLTTRLRIHLFRSIMRQDVAFFDEKENTVGALTTLLQADTTKVRTMTGQSFGSVIQAAAALTFGLTVSLTASWKYGLVLLACVPVLSIGEMLNMKNLADSTSLDETVAEGSARVSETVTMIKDVHAFGLEDKMAENYDAAISTTTAEERRKALRTGGSFGLAQALTMGFYGFAFWWGGQLIGKGELTFMDFMKSLWALGFCAAGAGQAATFAGDNRDGTASAGRIFKMIDRVPPVNAQPFIQFGKVIDNLKGKIEFKGVFFSYPTRDAPVLGGLDLQVNPGQTVALIGQSGSGKSTAIQLLERFYEIVRVTGKIYIDGVDLSELDLMWFRSNVGLVEQEPTLFSGSVHDNIAAGMPGGIATRDQVIAAAKTANAHEFIVRMPDGYDSDVGIGGGRVSGGQKQRISIARAIVNDPRILLLDEATSALDNESERLVQAALDGLLADGSKRSTIVIAHRLSTIRNADKIFLLENVDNAGGVVAESGTHAELIRAGGKYKALTSAYDQ
ncbi:ABC(ABCB) family transporter: multidrug (P-glycoprotein-like protein) (ABCB) [Ostreococcus lucimarinus CCE9901]|uniref:ABC(ABCB) family transporter: multidrug (P-glycoprotein-like protein) (ABCB) n=1 Tax=Ostreococcus lucimarinus (strain CCE9901) TaxID=436017 RepID=A4RRN9_OSTLU|nr:ABC(ABCB) family transporter: multidrug (P-glycoprotein-like protein) (ABCB) [Ostreococcus lucimarinus CCE9901]ABO93894.1 ABC(ABCB) family transporter: multidrug (P-glycoprotein-like protein) (ABCB) [Ostreococcus lucimarinus CCE9901]|eukprot:XP_001415602.1 ABC(ABCB) family transporter: multidrug (P-glycoprotein-like protein) (ABCB) [Ostreococcus lucimarinus CCE9901]